MPARTLTSHHTLHRSVFHVAGVRWYVPNAREEAPGLPILSSCHVECIQSKGSVPRIDPVQKGRVHVLCGAVSLINCELAKAIVRGEGKRRGSQTDAILSLMFPSPCKLAQQVVLMQSLWIPTMYWGRTLAVCEQHQCSRKRPTVMQSASGLTAEPLSVFYSVLARVLEASLSFSLSLIHI